MRVPALLLLLLSTAFAADIGLGPVPTNSTLLKPGPIGSTTPSSGAFTTLSATGQITSTLADGTPPLVVASTTNIPNLNASTLSGATFAAPGAIGSGTPNTGAFTTLSTTGRTTAADRITITLTDAVTSSASTPMILDHVSTGTPAAGFGDQIVWRSSSDTTAARNQALMLAEWATVTDASRKGRLSLWAYDTAAREGLRIEATGSGATVALASGGVGNVLVGTTTDDGANKLQVAGNLSLTTAGNGLKVKEGSNARMGNATLSSGTVTVSNTSVTASTRIFLTPHGSTIAAVGVSAVSAGTSFTIKSSSGSDANTVDWLLVEPSP